MIVPQAGLDLLPETVPNAFPLASFHPSFHTVYERLRKWVARFPFRVDYSIFSDLYLFYLLATKKYLDHRNDSHIHRLILSIHLMQRHLLRTATFSPHVRHLQIRWVNARLQFPFFTRAVLGCLIGFNVMDRYELFDEENILLALQKHLPDLKLVKESSYCHNSQHKNLKIFYLEIEKRDGSYFTLEEQLLLKLSLEGKIRNSIQRLSPTIFMGHNHEEIYKNLLVLSQEVDSIHSFPQGYITLDQQTGQEIVFRCILVYVRPFHRFALKERFFECAFVSERALTAKHIDNHPVEAHVFRLHLPRDASCLRSDGSLDFYTARQKVVHLITSAVGEFRDYNGGILLKQQEIFHRFKERFPDEASKDLELMETFFYGLVPLEKQVLLHETVLATLFARFLERRKEKLPAETPYELHIQAIQGTLFISMRSEDMAIKSVLLSVLQEEKFFTRDIAYNFIDAAEGLFFNCALLNPESSLAKDLIEALQDALAKWRRQAQEQQVLRIGLEYMTVSLDPRIGGEAISGNILRFLFEGLTRFDRNGHPENGVAESIEISPNLREYTFKLRLSQWNDGSPLSAYDFEYAWKKILSPDFKTSFAYFFYAIQNAKEAKEGKVGLNEVGIQVIDDRTLKVTLVRPMPHFLHWTAHPVYSPIHRFVDQEHPQWPYECQKNYPCNGPFQLKINHPSQGYHLTKNPHYWDTRNIHWDQVILTYMSSSQAMQAFHKREVDWIGNPFGAWHGTYIPTDEDQVVSYPSSWVCWSVFNTMRPPFNHPKFRKAIAYALNRAQIVANSFLPITPAYAPLLAHHKGSQHPLYPEYNQEAARRLFKEAMQELGITEKDLSPIQLIFTGKGIREYIAICLKQQLKECFGITCEMQAYPWSSVFDLTTRGAFQIALIHWNSWFDDPSYTLNAFKYASEEINFSKWENPEFQRLLDLSDAEANPFQRSSYLLQAEEILSKEMPVIPICYLPTQALVRKEFQIFYRTPCGPFNLARSFYKRKMEV